ncbi:murein transglycosylase protein [Rutstroemia sp. NJR-2017a WRK4]|nr:murein transglycosylase protein [Rutstroemia sp. NJR-2017a WRK4]
MISLLALSLLFSHLLLPSAAQLTGPVGVTTPLSEKTFECNILDYGATAGSSDDVSIPITAAFEECVQSRPGSRLIVPAGNWTLKTSIVLSNATNWAFQLDGLITAVYYPNSTDPSYTIPYLVPRERILEGFAGADALNKTVNGEGDGQFLQDFIVIVNAVDFELYSANGLGAIQGQGYLYRISGKSVTPLSRILHTYHVSSTNRPRMLRLISPINSTVHDLLLIDSPKFHFVFDFGVNLEVYHLTIRGANLGSYDGIDAIGTNYYIHDSEVTNRDECVSIKSPSHHALVENLVCNRVGSGISIGSLNNSAEISDIHARNISVIGGNEIAFIKTYPGGSGYVRNILWENFRSKYSLYGVNLNQYWQEVFTPDTGAVALSNITFRNFSGSIANGSVRPPLYLFASDLTPAVDITIDGFSVWTEAGSRVINKISNIFGTADSVYGPNDGIKTLAAGATPTTYTSSYTITTPPVAGWTVPPDPSWIAPSSAWGTTDPIPAYTPAPLWRPTGDYDVHYWGSF